MHAVSTSNDGSNDVIKDGVSNTQKQHRLINSRSKLSQIIQIDCCFYGTVRCVFINRKDGCAIGVPLLNAPI